METDFYNVSERLCDGGHVCTPPKECCSLGCCYLTFPQLGNSVAEMFRFLFWYYWYLWVAVFLGLTITAFCGFWLCRRRQVNDLDDSTSSDRVCYYPAPNARCNPTLQPLPPPYNEVAAKPNLYPLVIDFDEGFSKETSGFVMRCFRSLSRASTLDSLSSSFMCNAVNEANTIIPPPYSCNNSIDELSAAAARERPSNFGDGSIASLAHNHTTSDVSSLAAQSPLSPPKATSPTIELQELLEKIHQLPQLPALQPQRRPQALFSFGESSNSYLKTRRARGKSYIPVGPPPTSYSRVKSSRSWLSRSAPSTPSGSTTPVATTFQHLLMAQNGHGDNNRLQAVPLLLAEQDESDIAGNSDVNC